ncbi:MAG TPA: hypothetical protein PLM24_02910 [Methanothrix sp.]|nr:hypothetical protein [Methanothrix sp.]HPJ83606.1 hypothetical protein [Methanothrix sp.]HPR66066.1 hypothetical protein [Methanothrix sp.]
MRTFVWMAVLFGLIFMAYPAICEDAEQTETNVIGEVEMISESDVSEEMDELRGSDIKVQKADQYLAEKGFVPNEEITKDNFFGLKQSYAGLKDGMETEGTYELLIQEYSNTDSENAAAVGRTVVRVADGNMSEYTFVLEAPKTNVSQIAEYYVAESAGELEIMAANSWWTCMLGQLPVIGEECASGLETCASENSSIVGYLGCIATNCGEGFAKSSVCCSCDCNNWCEWAYGCCHM